MDSEQAEELARKLVGEIRRATDYESAPVVARALGNFRQACAALCMDGLFSTMEQVFEEAEREELRI